MPLLVLASAAVFSCASPTHHDGDAIRCAGTKRSDRLAGIDAPEMPGACRPGRECTLGDPFAARDHLASLTRGRDVSCTQLDRDHYGRRIVRCEADGTDLSCAMIADGFAVARYGALHCASQQRRAHDRTPEFGIETALATSGAQVAKLAWLLGAAWLLVANVLAYAVFAIDKSRAIASTSRRVRRIPESTLLALASIGGILGAIYAQQTLRHKTSKQPFAMLLLCIAIVEGIFVIGMATFYLF
jgi:uncharacterized membrane protein YsdA (DUF1294 family)